MIQGREGKALVVLAVAAFLGCLAIVQIASEPHRDSYQAQYTEGAGTDQELAEKRRGFKNKRPAPDRSVCSQAQTEKEYEMCQAWRAASAAQEAADAAWLQIYVSWVGLAGLLATVILTGIAAKAAAKAARETARSVEVQIRIEGPLLHAQEIMAKRAMPYQVIVVIRNSGNTPAILLEECADCQIGIDTLPPKPTYGYTRVLDQDLVDKGGKHLVFEFLPEEALLSVFDGTAPAIIWGNVLYENVFGQRRRMGFGFRTIPPVVIVPDGESEIEVLHWRRAGGKAYNYDREEKT